MKQAEAPRTAASSHSTGGRGHLRLRSSKLVGRGLTIALGALIFASLSSPAFAPAAHGGRWHVVERASVTEQGQPAPWSSASVGISSSGDLVAFAGGVPFLEVSTGGPRPMLYEVGSGLTSAVAADLGDVGDLECWFVGVRISGNGRYLLFSSPDRLVPGDGNNSCDLYVYDRIDHSVEGVLLGLTNGETLTAISGDGRYVAAALGELAILDRQTSDVESIVVDEHQSIGNPWLSADGRFVAYTLHDPSEPTDVYLVDRTVGVPERLTGFVSDRSDPSHPERKWNAGVFVFSPNMRFVAYSTEIYADDVGWDPVVAVGTSLLIHDRSLGTTSEVRITYAQLDNLLEGPVFAHLRPFFISDNGQVIYLRSAAGGSHPTRPPPAHLFELDRTTNPSETVDVSALEMIDVNSSGQPGDDSAQSAAAAADGSVVAFISNAGNLMPGEINNAGPGFNYPDVFVTSRSVFADTFGSIFESDIEWLAAEGITRGCNPPRNDRFCPSNSVTRGQMAAFLVRALGLVDRLDDAFLDDDDSIFEEDIEKLAAAGITKGCNPPTNDRFCPDSKVTRGQMAAFLVRALGYVDDGGGDLFIDDDDSIFEADIDKLGTAGVTRGCNPPSNDRFCPNTAVSRGQMAAFLHRALGRS